MSASPASHLPVHERIQRVTMFKLPDPAHQQQLIERYKDLVANNSRHGKPYILSLVVGPADEHPRSQGYTVVSRTEFASRDDVLFYDQECPAHQKLIAFIKTLVVEDIVTVVFKPQLVAP
ncbi:hypothetical protein CDD82_7809 [Ophiocordyceps australis]|uniref:Stress-response A/B barrel domain-containing protein n=1 Tax=Ophiocordyceps australis TaxID=1399860 RepID=A0A2C5YKS4_9HYPO|nr:hypothetical protein CDD82_7809 [Ophiocordyceps australis]